MAEKPAKTGKSTEVATKTQFTQSDIPFLLEKVNKQIKDLKGNRDKIVRINESLGNFGRINEIKDPQLLRGAYAYITKKAEANESYNSVFLEVDPSTKLDSFKEQGHSLKQWQDEILAQYAEVTYAGKLDKLQKVKEELEKNLSAEAKLAASLANIADIIGADSINATED